jgi:hypothetical protein
MRSLKLPPPTKTAVTPPVPKEGFAPPLLLTELQSVLVQVTFDFALNGYFPAIGIPKAK